MKKYSFKAKLIDAGGGGVYVEFPYDVETEFGVKGQVKIKATFNDVPYRGSLANMGMGCHIVPVLKKIREEIGKKVGDKIDVVIWRDTEERVVEVPSELKKALSKNKSAKAIFDKMAYSHRKEYANHVAEAKKEETRISRAQKSIDMILDWAKSKKK